MACGMLVLFNSCVMLLDIGRKWNMLSHNADSEHPKHAQWVTCPVSMLVIQELRYFILELWVIMLQHEVMVVDERHNNELQDL